MHRSRMQTPRFSQAAGSPGPRAASKCQTVRALEGASEGNLCDSGCVGGDDDRGRATTRGAARCVAKQGITATDRDATQPFVRDGKTNGDESPHLGGPVASHAGAHSRSALRVTAGQPGLRCGAVRCAVLAGLIGRRRVSACPKPARVLVAMGDLAGSASAAEARKQTQPPMAHAPPSRNGGARGMPNRTGTRVARTSIHTHRTYIRVLRRRPPESTGAASSAATDGHHRVRRVGVLACLQGCSSAHQRAAAAAAAAAAALFSYADGGGSPASEIYCKATLPPSSGRNPLFSFPGGLDRFALAALQAAARADER
ncbi:hypothetical protein Purlil1_586 [Purpureocillium lilacinum]|uniref:Uncharacterized protein n=1 Tax=Purpureocillium lilacinum TaxID=33203 RepID=A0ABR0CF65_PURLI|nr:hypothetical protein Purlil1_586 [Purpureocillium lilacinum]